MNKSTTDILKLYLRSPDKMYAGYMPINLKNNDEGSFFFWLATKRNNHVDTASITLDSEESFVIWLNGGPGCSSMVGMMWENGYVYVSYIKLY